MGRGAESCHLFGWLSFFKSCHSESTDPRDGKSEGDADAVAADYGHAQFLIVEYNTPQLAGDNDRSVLSKIEELRTQGQPIPSAYRRVGNYSVFVFNAEDEQTAKALIDQVEYEQVVQWLGDNPYLLEQAQREYYQTTAGVLLAVVKASGLSLLLCLAAGGSSAPSYSTEACATALCGSLFRRRRNARLNIDEITPQTDPAKLVGPEIDRKIRIHVEIG